MAKPEEFDIHVIIESLQGTCGTLSSAVNEAYPDMTEDDLTDEDHQLIDLEIFLCEECGWWCEIGEQHDDHCDDCCHEGCEQWEGED